MNIPVKVYETIPGNYSIAGAISLGEPFTFVNEGGQLYKVYQ